MRVNVKHHELEVKPAGHVIILGMCQVAGEKSVKINRRPGKPAESART
jgi:hypothetical protein